jgi:hypothetical protein
MEALENFMRQEIENKGFRKSNRGELTVLKDKVVNKNLYRD